MNFDRMLASLCPTSLRLPVRFFYYKLNGRLESELIQIKKLVGNGRRAIDVGANYGFYSYVLSKLFNNVEAFEPQKSCFEVIEAYSQSHQKNINAYNVALANFNGTLDLYTPIVKGEVYTGLASFVKPEEKHVHNTVPVCKLDDYQFTDVDFIKIDVEGFESEVIKGAEETIRREKPLILIEIEQRHLKEKPIELVFEQIIYLGYQGSFLKSEQLFPLSHFSYEKHQKPFEDDLLHYKYDLRNYVNNFLFKPI